MATVSARARIVRSDDRVPHSCPHINYVQGRLVRIAEWADERNEPLLATWAREAYHELDVVRSINRQLRRAHHPQEGTTP